MLPAGWAVFDVVVLGLTVLSVAVGAWRGLIYEVLSILGWVAALIVAPIFAAQAGNAVLPAAWNDGLRFAGGYLIVFIGAVFAGGLIALLAKKLIASVGLRPADRLFGAVFGLARAGVVMLALLVVVRLGGWHEAAWWKTSVTGPVLSGLTPAMKALLPQTLAQRL